MLYSKLAFPEPCLERWDALPWTLIGRGLWTKVHSYTSGACMSIDVWGQGLKNEDLAQAMAESTLQRDCIQPMNMGQWWQLAARRNSGGSWVVSRALSWDWTVLIWPIVAKWLLTSELGHSELELLRLAATLIKKAMRQNSLVPLQVVPSRLALVLMSGGKGQGRAMLLLPSLWIARGFQSVYRLLLLIFPKSFYFQLAFSCLELLLSAPIYHALWLLLSPLFSICTWPTLI